MMMTEPPKPVAGDELCPICGKPRSTHSPKQALECSHQIIERGTMRHCGTCGMTKPEEGVHDRCGKCGEKYTFVMD